MVCRYKHFPNPPQWFKANDGMWDGRILHSRDGLTYESTPVLHSKSSFISSGVANSFRYIGGDRRPWIPRGEMGGVPLPTFDGINPNAAWDSAMVTTVRGIVNRDGVIRMYKWGDALVSSQPIDFETL